MRRRRFAAEPVLFLAARFLRCACSAGFAGPRSCGHRFAIRDWSALDLQIERTMHYPAAPVWYKSRGRRAVRADSIHLSVDVPYRHVLRRQHDD